jgi:hypothetical protein
MIGQWPRRVYSVLCGLLAVVCLFFAVDQSFLAVACAFFALTSLSVIRNWRIGSWLAGISGAVLVLYALAVVLMGWEDVGGARGAIPLALGTGLVGGLGLVVAVGGGLQRGEAV